MEHRGLRRTPATRFLLHGVQAVLGHVQVERAQVNAAEIEQGLHDFGEVIALVGGDDLLLHFMGAMHDPAVQRHHVRRLHQVAGRVETVQVAEQEARGVAQAAVGVGVALQDFLRQRHLVAVVGAGDPQAQDVRAQGLHDVLRLDAVA